MAQLKVSKTTIARGDSVNVSLSSLPKTCTKLTTVIVYLSKTSATNYDGIVLLQKDMKIPSLAINFDNIIIPDNAPLGKMYIRVVLKGGCYGIMGAFQQVNITEKQEVITAPVQTPVETDIIAPKPSETPPTADEVKDVLQTTDKTTATTPITTAATAPEAPKATPLWMYAAVIAAVLGVSVFLWRKYKK